MIPNKFIIVLLVGLLTQATSIPLQAQYQVQLCEDPWPPYTSGKSGYLAEGGIAVKMMQRVFERAGAIIGQPIDLELLLLPWKRCLKDVDRGRLDGVMFALKYDNRRLFLRYSDALVLHRVAMFYNKKKFPDGVSWETYEDLKNFRIGLLTGSGGDQEFDTAVKKGIIKTDYSPDVSKNFTKLLDDRVDLLVCNELVAAQVIQKLGWEGKFATTPKPFREESYYMALGEKSPALPLMPYINQAIAEMKASGEMQAILLENY